MTLCSAIVLLASVVSFQGLTPDDSREGLANPERGWRFEIGVGRLAEDPCKFTHVTDQWPFHRFKADGVTVTQAYCYLTQFHDREISAEKIAALEADFARARRDGVKFLLRFAYDHDPYLKPTPNLERLLGHIAQLKPVVRRNIDVIYCLQMGWVGAWGEFHSSASGLEKDPASVAAIVRATLDLLPPERMTMMRRMDYKVNALAAMGVPTNEVSAATAWTAAPAARIGFFNDGTLANWWDGGTFVDEPYAEDGNREYDRVCREGLFTPVDGELFWTGQESRPCFACGIRAIERFSKQHYTTFSLVHGHGLLNPGGKPWTVDGWKVTPVTAEELSFYGIDFDPAYFEGVPHRTAYEFIRDHLGYRLALKSAELPVAEGEVRLTFHNYGFAAPVNPRKVVLVAVGKDGSVREIETDGDCRRMMPGKDFTVTARTTRAAGERFAIWLPDATPSLRLRPEYAIRLATKLSVETVGGRLLHGLPDPQDELAFNVDFWHFYSVAELSGTSSAVAQKWDAINLGKSGWRERYTADAAGATAYLDDILRGKVTRFMMNVNAQRSGFKSDVLETYGEAKVADNDTEANLVRVVRALREQKVDLYALWIGRCRERRVSPWLSVRMNDMHRFDLKDCPSISDFWRQHPELRRFKGETPKDCNGWAAQTFDFGQAVVRERMLNYIRECLAKYDVDGIELDWLRFPWLFARGEEAKNAPLLTEMVREIRRAADEAAKRRGHPVRVSSRATALPETEIAMGRAVDVWAREGLVDEVMAANHYKTVDFEIPVARWKQLLGPKVRFVGYADNGICDGPNGARRPMVLEEYYGWADQMHARGCRDFALYNLFGHDPRSTEWNGVLSGGLSPEAVARAARRYPLSFRDSRFTWSSIGTDHEYPQRLPSKLDKPFACGLDVGTVPAGSACELWLGFDKAEGELPKAGVNGVEVADAVPVEKSASLVRYAVPVGAVAAGRNSVTVQPALGHRLTYVALRVVGR